MTDPQIADESLVSDTSSESSTWADALILVLHIILPIAITGVILGRKAIFSKLYSHLDKSCIAIICPSFSKREKLRKWIDECLPSADGGGLLALWRDGSLMCTLINSAVPGACPNPHRHWKKPPLHGQALAYKYLAVVPVFNESDFTAPKPNAHQEKLLFDYVADLQNAIERLTPNEELLTYSNRYVARGMGLVTGEQHRRTVIYIYPNGGKAHSGDDLLVSVRGPYNTYGAVTIAAREFTLAQRSPAVAPDKGHTSFLQSLQTDFSNLLKPKDKGPACDIRMRILFEKDRAKLVFVPNNSGVYEICLSTNGEHIAGSPFNLNIEKNRSGVVDDLDEEELHKERTAKVLKKKVINDSVVYYKNPKKEDDIDGGKCQISMQPDVVPEVVDKPKPNYFVKEEDKLKLLAQKMNSIDLPEFDKLDKSPDPVEQLSQEEEEEEEEEILECSNSEPKLPILDTLEELDSLLESSQALKLEPEENYGLNIVGCLRDIPELKLEPEAKVLKQQTRFAELSQNSHQKPNLLLTSVPPCEHHSKVEFDHKTDYEKYTNDFDKLRRKMDDLVINQEFTKPDVCDPLEDSGTFVNDDIDPDSLTSSSVEIQGSCEEISGGASDEHEVNNNDILVKSSEDFCYLILNRSHDVAHERVYSKDFISCGEGSAGKSKDDLSLSDPNLLRAPPPPSASALSMDNVQEAQENVPKAPPVTLSASRTSFQRRAHEESTIAGTRTHSYSIGNLLDARHAPGGDGLEFKQHFLRRKAFWTNMSASNTNLTESVPKTVTQQQRVMALSLNALEPDVKKTVEKRFLQRTESTRSVCGDEYKSRSLDYVKQRKKNAALEVGTAHGKFGSVGNLHFPSVRHRREVYLKDQPSQHPERNQDAYAVFGDRSSMSIHEKIKCFERPQSPSPTSPTPLQSLPENITITWKIKERFEKAHNYFKHLERRQSGSSARRYSLDGGPVVYVPPAEVQQVVRPEKEKAKVRKTVSQPVANTISGCGVGLHDRDRYLSNRRLDERSAHNASGEDALEIFLKQRKRKKTSRAHANDVFQS